MSEHEPTEEEWAIFRDPMLTHSEALTAMNAIRDKRIRADAADTIDALTEALAEAENALADYIPTIERTGASLNYGHAVLRKVRAALARARGG